MMKRFIVRVNYVDYMIEMSDAVVLLDIVSRMSVVKQNDYSGPYFIQPGREPFVESVILADVEESGTEEPGAEDPGMPYEQPPSKTDPVPF